MRLCLAISALLVILGTVDGTGMAKLQRLQAEKTIPAERGRPLELHLGVYIESISNFRTQEMVFDVDLYMYTSWRDPRLRHNSTEDIVLINDKATRDMMWLPDLYFANARSCHFQEVTVPNFNLFVDHDGVVSYSLRATCAISCSLDLVNYPMDRQHCFIRVISYAHTSEQLRVRWFSEAPLRMNEEIELPEYSIDKIRPDYCNHGVYRYAITEKSFRTGNFSCLEAGLFLARALGYNLVQSYIPTGLIVAISWVSFFIDRRAVPARVTLSFTTLVSLTTLYSAQGNGLRYDLPQVSYAKAIDLWYGACLLFVFLSLIEFAAVNSYMRTSDKFATIASRQHTRRPALHARTIHRDPSSLSHSDSIDRSDSKGAFPHEQEELLESGEKVYPVWFPHPPIHEQAPASEYFTRLSVEASHFALRIDKCSRVVFPCTFVAFNIVYWSYYKSS